MREGESMKKIIALLVVCLICNSGVFAKDYAKIQIQEMKKAQKYNTTDKYYSDYSQDKNLQSNNIEIKDPKLIKLSGYAPIDSKKLNAKNAQDNLKYAKIKSNLCAKKTSSFSSQAYAEDFYHIYRVAERIIRANKLDYISWRIFIAKDSSFNASSTQTNCIIINSGAYDTLAHNEDALALLIGHEMGHALLGHRTRKMQYQRNIDRASGINYIWYVIACNRYNSASKKMEYAADTEGAKLIVRAGYDLNSAKETLSFINTLGDDSEYDSTHPSGEHRLQNYAEVRRYFMEDEWKKQGIYNLYHSDVMVPRISSDKKSLILEAEKSQPRDEVYTTENMADVYTRHAYKSYLNGDFKKAEEYFGKLLELDKNNPVAYLYFSYTEECLYKITGKEKYLENAKAFASYAQKLAPNNKYIKEQVGCL